jgi:Flp pilus assembly protein TadD
MAPDDLYELFQNGMRLLEERDYHAAAVPLARVRAVEPDKTSIREAFGRALFGSQRYREAAEEFEAVVDRAPTNDYAQFCLGRCLQQLGRHAEARRPLALACCLRPERADYRLYRDRARANSAWDA